MTNYTFKVHMKNENLITKNLMLDLVSLKKFDKLVGSQNRSQVIRQLIDFYIGNPNIFMEENEKEYIGSKTEN